MIRKEKLPETQLMALICSSFGSIAKRSWGAAFVRDGAEITCQVAFDIVRELQSKYDLV